MMKKKLKIISPHPVQYQVPLWRQLIADGWQLDVAYYHRGSAAQPALDTDFGIEIQWDVDLLGGYPHVFFNQEKATFSLREQIACFRKMLAWMFEDRGVPVLFMGWFAESIWALWLIAVLLHRPHLMISETTPGSFNSAPKPHWRVSFLKWLLKKPQPAFILENSTANFCWQWVWTNQDYFTRRIASMSIVLPINHPACKANARNCVAFMVLALNCPPFYFADN